MSKLKAYLGWSVCLALLFGLISGNMVEFYYAFPSSDWAANGVPLFQRMSQTWLWFLAGFVPGAVFGFFLGLVTARYVPLNLDEDLSEDADSKSLLWANRIGNLVVGGMLIFGVLVVADVL